MAALGEVGRRLRPRPAPSQPLTRSSAATAAAVLDPPRRTKTAPKRAAMDENLRASCAAAPAQQAKKRAALANLTNYSGASSTRINNAQASKGQAVGQAAVAKVKTRAAAQVKELQPDSVILIAGHNKSHDREPSSARNSEVNSSITDQNDENAYPGTTKTSLEVKSQAVAAIHKRCNEVKPFAPLTEHNFYISQDSKSRVRQGYLFQQHLEDEGWSSKNYTDIDEDLKDPQMCGSYAADIYQHLRMAELKRRPATNFMEVFQRDINASMRGILVDWLVEVADEYKLVPDTLYLTISYVDRFLSGNLVQRQRLQLLGVSCMLIASKYEEICAPQVDDFCFITDNTYTREEVLDMERQVLNYLRFELAGPTTKSFVRRFIRAAQAGMKIPTLQLEFLGNYLAELTLAEYGFLQYLPSMIAASAVFMAKATLIPTDKPWTSTLRHYSGYRPSELKECAKAIHDLQCNKKNCTLPAVREKYRQHKFKCVATIAAPARIPLEFFDDLE